MNREFDFGATKIAPGLSVIEASAGTGKTHAISHLVPRLLLDGTAATLGEILLVTFTNDAARELSDRVRRVLENLHAPPADDEAAADSSIHALRTKYGAEKIRTVIGRALLDLDRLGVSTIHSFCQRTLQSEGTLCGLPVVPELIPNADAIIDEALCDYWEERIATDARVASVAAVRKWKLAEDLKFMRFALPLRDAVALPTPQDFEAGLDRLDALARQFDPDVCDALEGLLNADVTWTAKAPDAKKRARFPDALREAGHAHSPGFLEAAGHVAGAAAWINKTKNRAQSDALSNSSAVALAQEVAAILPPLRWDFRNAMLREIRATTDAALRASRQITYDGLIDSLAAALSGPHAHTLAGRLRDRHTVALIDESQDTDPRQFGIFQKVFIGFEGETLPGHRLVLIGDPKQAIYAFRGADVNTYLAARTDAGRNVFQLTKTHRAPEPLVQAVNALFVRDGSLLKDGLTFAPGRSALESDVQLKVDGESSNARIEAWIVPDADARNFSNQKKRTAQIAATVASEIARILNGNSELADRVKNGKSLAKPEPVQPGDIAVLVSAHAEAEAVSDALRERRVPAIRAGTGDIMASDEAAELLVLLRALHDPRQAGLRLAAMATRLLGRRHADIRKLRDDSENDDLHIEKFLSWQDEWHRCGVASALARIDESEAVIARLATLPDGERRVTNVRQLTDLLQSTSAKWSRRPGHLVRWLAREISQADSRAAADERQLQLESDADAVQIVTMHAAKGLEYPLVFCPFLWKSPPPKGVQRLALAGHPVRFVDGDTHDDPAVAAALERTALEDRLRLAYVAITRAKVKAWILCGETCGPKSRQAASAIDWLLRADGTEYSADWRESAAAAGRGLRHEKGWRTLAAACGTPGAIAFREPPPPDDVPWEKRTRLESPALAARAAPPVPSAWGMTSFSALTKEKNPHGAESADHPPASPAALSQTPAATETSGNPFRAAPGGAMMGTAIHDWIEGWNFSEIRETEIQAHLANYPLPMPKAASTVEPPLFQSVSGMLEELRDAVLPGLNCPVRTACPLAKASEWHFQLPIARSLSAQRLADVFAAHGNPDYAARLSTLPMEDLAGYLHGFLDRIAFHNDTWGVIDWKTNNLGSAAENYRVESLQDAAYRSHYHLQAHLYLVALRRYLGKQSRICGAWLIFLRGIRAQSAEGILHIQPSEHMLADLDALFATPSGPTTPKP